MQWIVSNWRLKLLAIALAVGLLAAVAFSENPITLRTVPAAIDYDNLAPGVVVINPTLRQNVNVSGFSSAVNGISASLPNGLRLRVDLRGIDKPVTHKTFYATPKTLPNGVTWTGDAVPITIDIDSLPAPKSLPIEVRTPKVAPGYIVLHSDPLQTYAWCHNNSKETCQVVVTAPASVLEGLKAFVQVTDQVTGTAVESPSQAVQFEQNGRPFDLYGFSTFPSVGVDPSTVNVHITAQQTQVSRQVAVHAPITGRPACGYQITAIGYQPEPFVTITGPGDAVAKVDSITLSQAIDVSNATSGSRVVETVPTDAGVIANPAQVTVTVSISKQIDCSAPTPTPSKTP
jgi:hypothetical protein